MKKFKYTQSGGILTEDQRRFYEDNGYIVIKNNVSHELLDKIRDHFIAICEGRIDVGYMIVMKNPSLNSKGVKGEYLINKIQDFLHDDVLFEYISDKAVVDIVASIIGPNITGAHSMLINKPPNSDPDASLHPLHQDLHYFPFRPADRVVASWTAMERVDEKNGCLYVVPGSHTSELYPHSYPMGYKKNMYHGVQGLDHFPRINLIMEKGDSVFFHPLLLHGSGPNLTKGFRKAISCHYADSNCYFINMKETSQENIATEMETLTLKRGVLIDVATLYKSKSRLVRGVPGNFQNMESHL